MRIRRPDKKNALDIVEEAEREMKFTLSLPLTDDSAFTLIRNIYECFRMLGDALLIAEGKESIDHLEPINALLRLDADVRRPLSSIDNLRRLRHNINYYGYKPNVSEAADAIDISKSVFPALLKKVRQISESLDIPGTSETKYVPAKKSMKKSL